MDRTWEELSHRCIWDVFTGWTLQPMDFTIDRWISKIWLPLAQVTNRAVKWERTTCSVILYTKLYHVNEPWNWLIKIGVNLLNPFLLIKKTSLPISYSVKTSGHAKRPDLINLHHIVLQPEALGSVTCFRLQRMKPRSEGRIPIWTGDRRTFNWELFVSREMEDFKARS